MSSSTHCVALVLLSRRSVALVIGFGRSSNSVLYLMFVQLSRRGFRGPDLAFSRLNCIQERVQSFGGKKFISHMMGSLGRFSNLWFSCGTHPQHAWTIAVDQRWQSIVWQSWFESKLWQKQPFRFFFAEGIRLLLWRIERSLHEEDPGHHHGEHVDKNWLPKKIKPPGHHHGEHVLHPRRHLVGGRRPEVDVEHSDLAKIV